MLLYLQKLRRFTLIFNIVSDNVSENNLKIKMTVSYNEERTPKQNCVRCARSPSVHSLEKRLRGKNVGILKSCPHIADVRWSEGTIVFIIKWSFTNQRQFRMNYFDSHYNRARVCLYVC